MTDIGGPISRLQLRISMHVLYYFWMLNRVKQKFLDSSLRIWTCRRHPKS